MADTYYPYGNNNNNDGGGFPSFNAVNSSSLPKPMLDRHREDANYAYFDGHVKWLNKETVEGVFSQHGTTGISEVVGQNLPIVFGRN